MTESPDPGLRSVSRRTVLQTLAAGTGLATLGAVGGSSKTDDYWTVVALPDTQYNARSQEYSLAQTEWIVDNLETENIAFVSHEGDVVQNPDEEVEWEYMDDALSLLDGQVPYAMLPGEHDYLTRGDRSSSIRRYKRYFGPERFQSRDWYGGAGPTNGDENRDNLNSYQLFSAGGYEFLHLALQWEAPGSVTEPSTPLGWAQTVLNQYPDRPTILTTHSYLSGRAEARTTDVEEANGNGNSGATIWETLVKPNTQIFMVLCGHSWQSDGEYHQVSGNDACGSVYEMLANYQSREDRGHGYLRRIEFQPGAGSTAPDRIQVRTYSPVLDEYMTDSDSQFAFDIDFDKRFGTSSTFATDCSGDADGDSDIDGEDTDVVQRRITNDDVNVDTDAADMDGDGDIDIGDAVRIRDKGRGY
jgi:hypothetical protein